MIKKVLISLVLLAGLAGTVFYFTQKNDVSDISLQQSDKVSGSWRYKLTVVVDTPEGEKTGSAVREVSVRVMSSILTSKGKVWKATVRGEAVVVDLGARGKIFSLLDSDDSYQIVYEAFPTEHAPLTEEGVAYYNRLYKNVIGKKVRVARPMRNVPRLVYFENILDPKTVVSLNRNALSDVLGEGVSLKGIYIEMSDAPMTKKINSLLPWLAGLKGGYLDGKYAGGGPELSNILHGGNFAMGVMFDE